MVNEKIKKYKGTVIITNKKNKKKFVFKNVVCDGFYDIVADLVSGSTSTTISYLGIGTGLNTAQTTDTSLQTEVTRVPITIASSSESEIHIQTEVGGGIAVLTWKELGLFNASSAGTLTNRVNVDYTHNAGEVSTIDWYIDKS